MRISLRNGSQTTAQLVLHPSRQRPAGGIPAPQIFLERLPAILFPRLSLVAQPARADADPAATVYERSGVQGGLVVELGFVDAEFTAKLGGPDAVH